MEGCSVFNKPTTPSPRFTPRAETSLEQPRGRLNPPPPASPKKRGFSPLAELSSERVSSDEEPNAKRRRANIPLHLTASPSDSSLTTSPPESEFEFDLTPFDAHHPAGVSQAKPCNTADIGQFDLPPLLDFNAGSSPENKAETESIINILLSHLPLPPGFDIVSKSKEVDHAKKPDPPFVSDLSFTNENGLVQFTRNPLTTYFVGTSVPHIF
jgi:hypothetical protein